MKITKEMLENLYVKQGLTVRECAKTLGLATHGGLSWHFKKFGIIARPAKFQVGNRKKGDRKPETHGSWKGGKQLIQCTQCGQEVLRFPSQVHKSNFCSDKCYSDWKSENFKGKDNPNFGNSILKGERNPNWQGGIGCEPYAPIFVDKRFKAGIRERDNFECQNPDCRKNCDTLTIHHIDYNKKNCKPINLITLCNSCNARANFNRDFWQAGYTEIIRLKYEVINQKAAI
jgi:hypothetical protein